MIVMHRRSRRTFGERPTQGRTSARVTPTPGSPPAVLVLADTRIHLEALSELLRRAGHQVVGVARELEEAIALIAERQPDVLLLDIAAEAAHAARMLGAAAPEVILVALGVAKREEQVMACMEAGVTTCVPCDASSAAVVEAVESAARGETVLSPPMAARLVRRLADIARAQERPNASAELTARELEVAELVRRRLSDKEIAQKLMIEVSTAKRHVHSILQKLGVHRRVDIADALGGRIREPNR